MSKLRLGLGLPLDVRGTAFQQRVWQALREIPSGSTASYTEICGAHRRSKQRTRRRWACGANRLAIAIPVPPRDQNGRIALRLSLEASSASGTCFEREYTLIGNPSF